MTAPCKGCPDRQADPPCHATCGKYLEYRKERDEYLRARHDEGMIEYAHIHKLDGIRRAYAMKRKREGK